MKKRNGTGSRRLVEMTTKFQESQHRLLDTLCEKGLLSAGEHKRMSAAVDRAVAQKRSSDVLSTATALHARTMQALDGSISDAPEQREAKEIESLLGVTQLFAAQGKSTDMFDRSLALLKKTLCFEDGTLFLYDREEERLEPIATSGARVDLIDGVRFDMGNGLSAWVAKKKKPILIAELARASADGGPMIASFLSVPIVVSNEMIGVLNLSHSTPRAFGEDDLRLARLYGSVVAGPLERILTQREIKRQAVQDRLTGLYNRRHFQERIRHEIERARRVFQPISLLLVDVDNFAAFNDRYGNAVGDRALVEISKVLQRASRSTDIVARYGGEEFVVLMPQTSAGEVVVAAERLRKSIESHTFPQKRRVTVSLGAASFPEDAEGDLDLVAKAEQALYMAKKNGRNRAVSFHALAVH